MGNSLKLLVMPNIREFGKLVDENLKLIRNCAESSILDINLDRFSNGEGKATLNDSARGQNIFLLSDVGHYGKSSEYISRGRSCLKSPDDHFQDLKRAISAMDGKANKLYVVTPLLYESRQDKRAKDTNESLDCKEALQELEIRNVDGIITFDAHNPVACENALKNTTFDNLYPTYSILKRFITDENYESDKLLVIAPDKGAMDRAIYYANSLGVDVGMFYKRRDYSKVVNGKNPVVEHKYLGGDVNGKDLIIVDDMIASGGSMLEVAKELKKRGARRIYLVATFSLFTDGEKSVKNFDDAYSDGVFYKLLTTNVTYVPQYIKDKPWYNEVDLSKYLAKIIYTINEGRSIKDITDGKEKLAQKMKSLGKYPLNNR